MIEVNLLPGGKKGRSRSFQFKLPSLSGGGLPDPYIMFTVAAGIVALGYMGWAYMGARGEAEELGVQLSEALADSARFSDQIARADELIARGDSIAQRVAIIQDIDVGRYVWPHILDEVARAIPDYIWLRELLFTGQDPLQIRISGNAGSIPAVTAFMRNLEASRFLRAIETERNELVPSEVNPDDLVYIFELVATYDPPPMDELETVPLFDDVSIAAQQAVPDTTGGN